MIPKHGQPSNLQIAGDILLFTTAVAAGVVAGIGILARNTLEQWLR